VERQGKGKGEKKGSPQQVRYFGDGDNIIFLNTRQAKPAEHNTMHCSTSAASIAIYYR